VPVGVLGTLEGSGVEPGHEARRHRDAVAAVERDRLGEPSDRARGFGRADVAPGPRGRDPCTDEDGEAFDQDGGRRES
jgi:hypothetical protein